MPVLPPSVRWTATGLLIGAAIALIIVAAASQRTGDGAGARIVHAGVVPFDAAVAATTTPPEAGPLNVTAVGDSVMLAAVDQLEADGIHVDAVVGRGVPATIDALRGIVDRGELGDEVLIHIGHNSVFTPEQFDEFMALADGRPTYFMTVNVPLDWEAPNNQVIRDGAARYENATVLEWKDAVTGHPELFWDDGIHLRPAGAAFYVEYVEAALR